MSQRPQLHDRRPYTSPMAIDHARFPDGGRRKTWGGGKLVVSAPESIMYGTDSEILMAWHAVVLCIRSQFHLWQLLLQLDPRRRTTYSRLGRSYPLIHPVDASVYSYTSWESMMADYGLLPVENICCLVAMIRRALGRRGIVPMMRASLGKRAHTIDAFPELAHGAAKIILATIRRSSFISPPALPASPGSLELWVRTMMESTYLGVPDLYIGNPLDHLVDEFPMNDPDYEYPPGWDDQSLFAQHKRFPHDEEPCVRRGIFDGIEFLFA